MIEYRLIRSGRRTLSITVQTDGAVVVRAPFFTPRKEIEAFLQKKQAWIEQKQALAGQTFQLSEGALLPCLGESLVVHFCRIPMAMKYHGHLLVPIYQPMQEIRLWRKAYAQQVLDPRVAYWTQRTGLCPTALRYTHTASRWGSMTGRGVMALSSALIHLPLDLCDYVIVHELCHLRQPNHSPAFHALVRTYLPDAEERRQRLRQSAALARLCAGPDVENQP